MENNEMLEMVRLDLKLNDLSILKIIKYSFNIFKTSKLSFLIHGMINIFLISGVILLMYKNMGVDVFSAKVDVYQTVLKLEEYKYIFMITSLLVGFINFTNYCLVLKKTSEVLDDRKTKLNLVRFFKLLVIYTIFYSIYILLGRINNSTLSLILFSLFLVFFINLIFLPILYVNRGLELRESFMLSFSITARKSFKVVLLLLMNVLWITTMFFLYLMVLEIFILLASSINIFSSQMLSYILSIIIGIFFAFSWTIIVISIQVLYNNLEHRMLKIN